MCCYIVALTVCYYFRIWWSRSVASWDRKRRHWLGCTASASAWRKSQVCQRRHSSRKKNSFGAREWGEVTNEFHNSNKIPCSCHVMHSLRLINAINNCTFRVSTDVDPRSQLCRGLHIISRHFFFFLSFRVSFNSFFFFHSSRAYRGLKAKRVNFLIKNAQQQQLDDDTPVNTQVKEGVREALKKLFLFFFSLYTFLRRIEDKQSWRENYR